MYTETVCNATDISFLTLTANQSPNTKGKFNPVYEPLVAPLGIGNCVIIAPFFTMFIVTPGGGGLPNGGGEIVCE
jgi:hypothetical protein